MNNKFFTTEISTNGFIYKTLEEVLDWIDHRPSDNLCLFFTQAVCLGYLLTVVVPLTILNLIYNLEPFYLLKHYGGSLDFLTLMLVGTLTGFVIVVGSVLCLGAVGYVLILLGHLAWYGQFILDFDVQDKNPLKWTKVLSTPYKWLRKLHSKMCVNVKFKD